MTGFVSSPPATVIDPENPALDLVAGDDFYPAVSIAEARSALRLNTNVVDGRMREALRAGMIAVRRELAQWKILAIAAGAASLEDVIDEEVDGERALVLLYRRAVFANAAAELSETHGEISATSEGRERGEDRTLSADDHRRNATHAIRDILGVTRTAVALI